MHFFNKIIKISKQTSKWLSNHIQSCVNLGVYDSEILSLYTEEEINRLGSFIKHSRDYLFTYAGLRQIVDKFLPHSKSSYLST